MADGSVRIDIEADGSQAEKELRNVGDAAQDAGRNAQDAGGGIDDLSNSLDDVGDGANTAGDGLDDLADGAKNAADGLGVADVAAGNFIANGLQSLISGVGDAVSSLLELGDSTREYREDMAKLDTAFTTTGHSADAAKEVYRDFYAILGESDRSVEAANHLAELTQNEQELAKWSDIAAGVTAKFGDSLPLEGLTEAANETAKVGKVTGPLADALNWATMSSEQWNAVLGEGTAAQSAFNSAIEEGLPVEDAFNAALAEISSEQERSTLITETLNSAYKEAADQYNELTASSQAARDAEADMAEVQAELGKAIEPVTTAWTNLKTQGLEAIVPAVEFVSGAIEDLTTWLGENETAADILKGVVIALAAAFAVLAAAFGIHTLIQMVAKAFHALNLSMLANPAVWIAAAIIGLVAAFIYLWNNCEGFRNFWIGLWETIKSAAAAVADWFVSAWGEVVSFLISIWEPVKEFFVNLWNSIVESLQPVISAVGNAFSAAWSLIQTVWSAAEPFFSAVWDGIKAVFAVVIAVLGGFFKGAWEAIKAVWSVVVGFFGVVWDGIKAVFSVVASVLGGFFKLAWSAIKAVWSTVTGYFAAVWNTIAGIFSAVEAVLSGDFQGAWDAIQGILDTWADFFSGVWESIKDVFGDAVDVGSKIVDDIKSGISGAWESLKSWFTGIWDSLFGNLTANVSVTGGGGGGNTTVGKYAKGLEYVPYDDFPALLHKGERVLTAEENAAYSALARASVGSSGATVSRNMSSSDTGLYDLARAVGTQTAGINSLSAEYRRGSTSMRPIILELDRRELGRAVVDVGATETTRVGAKLALGGA